MLFGTESRTDFSSSDDEFFEGREKLFEVTFAQGKQGIQENHEGLRLVKRKTWEDMLRLVHCEIVSVISNDNMDAFLLSESSMFVYPRKLLIKTCGTILLLNCVTRVLEIAKSCGLIEIESAFYTRKNFLEPERQPFPHANFADEVSALNDIFGGGLNQVLGPLEDDHYYVYAVENCQRKDETPIQPDHTIEILMHDLDVDRAKIFYRGENFKNSSDTTKNAGIQALFPSADIDDFVFNPCGYSANGVVDQHYFTIHVTPQPSFSFASFETNSEMLSYDNLITQVLGIFQPGRFSVCFFTNTTTPKIFHPTILGYCQNHSANSKIGTYDVTYLHFSKLEGASA